jgi:hypothetical protein
MRKTVFFAFMAAALLLSGCASKRGYLQGPFGNYTHETFLREGTGETGLYLEGETWCTLVDLNGFRDVNKPLESSNQFLARKNSKDILVTVSAEKIDTATNEETCRKSIYRNQFHRTDVYVRTIGNRKVLLNTYEGRKQVDYCPFYKGYCFDFQFTMDAKTSEKALQGILQSIVFADDLSLRGKVQKIFYIYDSKLQFGMPDTWKYRFNSGLMTKPAIVFQPVTGDAFTLYLSPYEGFDRGSAVSRDKLKALFGENMSDWQERNADDPPVVELIDEQEGLYIAYFDIKDQYYHADDSGEYPYERHGYAVKGKAAFLFRIFFREEGRADVEKAISALAHMKILDIDTEPVIDIVKRKK